MKVSRGVNGMPCDVQCTNDSETAQCYVCCYLCCSYKCIKDNTSCEIGIFACSYGEKVDNTTYDCTYIMPCCCCIDRYHGEHFDNKYVMWLGLIDSECCCFPCVATDFKYLTRPKWWCKRSCLCFSCYDGVINKNPSNNYQIGKLLAETTELITKEKIVKLCWCVPIAKWVEIIEKDMYDNIVNNVDISEGLHKSDNYDSNVLDVINGYMHVPTYQTMAH